MGVENRNSTQGYAADRAALEPLFGVAWLETLLLIWQWFSELGARPRLLSKLPKRPAPQITGRYTPLFFREEMRIWIASVRTASWHMMAKNMIIDFWTASRQLSSSNSSGLSASSFCHPVPAGLFPHMTRLELRVCNFNDSGPRDCVCERLLGLPGSRAADVELLTPWATLGGARKLFGVCARTTTSQGAFLDVG